MVDECKWSDIGNSFKQYLSPDIARKMNIITNSQISIDNKMEEVIMNKCASITIKSCVARLITQKMLIW